VPPKLVVQPADGPLAEPHLEVLQEVGRVLIAPVPVWRGVSTALKEKKKKKEKETYLLPPLASNAAG
jgi:hypothetical protein